MSPYPASYYALQAAEAHRRAQRAPDPALRHLIEDERSLWLELDAQSRMLDMVARSMRRAQGEAEARSAAVQALGETPLA